MFTANAVILSLVLLILSTFIFYTYRKPATHPYSVMLALLHFTYPVYRSLVSFSCLLVSGLPKATHNNDIITPAIVRDDAKRLDKIPKHLAVMFWGKTAAVEEVLTEQQNFTELAQLCCWAWCAGVKVLSFYDSEGYLKSNAHLIQSYIETVTCHFFARDKVIPTTRVMALGYTTQANDAEETFVPDLHVNLISQADGRARIVEITKVLAQDVVNKKIMRDYVDIEEVDRRLSVPQFPEPQLLITFSPEIDLDGFPPWHIRLTEIFHVPGNTRFDYSIFIKALYKYSKCDQRFGR